MLGTVVMDEISTPCPRSVVARGRQPGSEVRAGAGRSYPASEASSSQEEPPRPVVFALGKAGGWGDVKTER